MSSRSLLALGALLLLSACGFQLRGSATVPFDTLYLPRANTGIGLDLKRQIQAGTNAKVIEEQKQADAVLAFTEEIRQKEVLSLTSAGRVREFQLRYRVGFRVHDQRNRDYVPNTTIQLTRDVTFNDADILAKEQEEQLLYRDMQADMVQQIIRRLAAAKPPPPKPAPQ
ncbi:MAG TPA: LPS assembly lipoprotein LptE [Burkholderiales bacterium]|nr:LPS assembly lipoprotein LptE [Burkholderiales bacterium]